MEPFQIFNTSVKGIFFLSIISFIIFLIVLVVHYTVTPIPFLSFIKTNLVTDVADTNDYKLQTVSTVEWLKGTGDEKKLNFDTFIGNNFIKNSFTLSFDCYLSRTYKSTDVPRVLFYFANRYTSITQNSDLQETTENTDTKKNVLDSSSTNTYTITSENEPTLLTTDNSKIPRVFDNTNFIIYVDPIKNDMKFGVFIKNTAVQPKTYLEILPVLKNIPIEVPFQITFILTETFAEIYMNKELHTTYKIGKQYLEQFPSVPFNPVTVGGNMYGPIDFIGDTIRVGNIQYVNKPLTSQQVRTITNKLNLPIFFTKS